MTPYTKTLLKRLATNLLVVGVPTVVAWLKATSQDPLAGVWATIAAVAFYLLKGYQSNLDIKAPAK